MAKVKSDTRPYNPGDVAKLRVYLNKYAKGKPIAADVARKNKRDLIEWLKEKR